jgi:hypothetical protein
MGAQVKSTLPSGPVARLPSMRLSQVLVVQVAAEGPRAGPVAPVE